MIRAFVHGLGEYLRAFAGAFTRAGRQQAPLKPRRVLVLLLGFPAFLLLQLVHGLGFALDEIFFRGYRRVRVESPVFVAGIPRSGTTFVHRLLASDTDRYTTMRTWEALLAPSISQRYALKALGRCDRLFGSPGRRLIDWTVRRGQGDFADVHEIGLWAPEEDYLALLPVAGCFIMALAFPGHGPFWDLGRLDRMDEARRQRLLRSYKACLQKHLYVEGGGRRLLSKNAAFASWVPALRQTFPDAQILLCVREPLGALSSQLSAIRAGCQTFATLEAPLSARFQDLFEHAYARLAAELDGPLDRPPPSAGLRLAVLDQGDLAQAPGPVLRGALERAGIGVGPSLEQALASPPMCGRPGAHRHRASDYGLAWERLAPKLRSAYAEIRRHTSPPPGPGLLTGPP